MPIDKFLKSAGANAAFSGALGGVAGGALLSAFANKKSARKLLKTGGLVALGGAAWHAYQTYAKRNGDAVAAAGDPGMDAADRQAALVRDEMSLQRSGEEQAARLILQAMIAAGHADGHLSELERTRIWRRAMQAHLSPAALTDLQHMLEAPVNVEQLAAQAGDLHGRIEVYTASLLAIDADCPAGAGHLAALAAALQLPGELVSALHERVQQEESMTAGE